MADDDDEEEGRTLIAAPMPAGVWHGADPDALPDEDQTLIAIPRSYLRPEAPQVPQPRPAAGLPPATPPPPRPPEQTRPLARPAAGYPPAMPPPARPVQTMPAQLPPAQLPPAQLPRAQPQAIGFVPIDRTQELPKVMTPAYVPRPPAAPAAPPQAVGARPPPSTPPPAPSGEMVLAAPPEGVPVIVVRFLLLCGLVTVLGLLALIYLQL